MIRTPLVKRNLGTEKDFVSRGGEVSRIEAFSDAVFAFGITLIGVSLEVPKTFGELQATLLQGFLAFAFSFIMIMQVWYWHYKFFRRYGLQDFYTITLNSILLFVILFYIYPLKFLMNVAVTSFFHPIDNNIITDADFPKLMLIYSLGFVAVHVLFTLLYYHAYTKRMELKLNKIEVIITQASIQAYLVLASVGLISIGFAAIGYATWAGLIYMILFPALYISYGIFGRRKRKVKQSLVAANNEQELARSSVTGE
ncbi:MAG: TMEM175 family protein [Chloroflexota bacterium]|nr:TMEM175 family protein [Chloroflexota bacterium]